MRTGPHFFLGGIVVDKELSFYIIDEKYVKYLQDKELEKRGFTKVSNTFNLLYLHKKCYVGIIFEINGFKYLAPLTHPKTHYEENKQFFNRISTPINITTGEKTKYFGRIMYSYMIPVPTDDLIEEIIINDVDDYGYRMLLLTQYFFINDKKVKDSIYLKASMLYKKVCNNPNHYLSKVCCDFKYLEDISKDYTDQK